MNTDPIEDKGSIRALRCWMEGEGLHTLWDISLWSESIWAGWKRIEVPAHLNNKWSTLLDLLHGLAPTHMRKRDLKGWGPNAKGYAVSMGYAKLKERPYVPPDPAPW